MPREKPKPEKKGQKRSPHAILHVRLPVGLGEALAKAVKLHRPRTDKTKLVIEALEYLLAEMGYFKAEEE